LSGFEGSGQPDGASLAQSSGAGPMLTRRSLLHRAAVLGVSASTLSALDLLARVPARAAAHTKAALPEIQFQIEKFIAPALSVERVRVRFAPVYTTFATFALARTPTQADQATLAQALATVEASYPFTPSGVFLCVAYGIPYFERLPGGMAGTLVSGHMPRLVGEPQSYALEEAVPGPTDVSPQNPEVTKESFDIPVQIESNDMLVTLRSDSTEIIDDVLAWLAGESTTLAGENVGESGLGELLTVTSRRLMFTQIGLPRKIAEEQGLPYAETINPESPMWMGFASQQVGSSGKPPITTFLGNESARLTTARTGDYFDHGSIVHLSHAIQDLEQFYEAPKETYERRAAAMFSADPVPSAGNANQFAGGGGPAFLPNRFVTPEMAEYEAREPAKFDGERHIGHTTGVQRSSRAADGSPMHIRADGPGYDTLDVPDGSAQPKLHFSIFVPTAAFFATMRRSQASLDLAQRYNVPAQNLGIERFLTATRRQNFLVPPRRNRAFPLVELA
jgi:hypothetical protein